MAGFEQNIFVQHDEIVLGSVYQCYMINGTVFANPAIGKMKCYG